MLGRVSAKQGMFSKNTGNLRFLPIAWNYILRACGEATLCDGFVSSTKRALGLGLELLSVKCC
jgi:hypothetical protein